MECPSDKKSLSIADIYQLPSKDRVTNSTLIDDIIDHLTSVLPKTQRNMILGDFNIHVDNIKDNNSLAFNDTMMALGFEQCVNSRMHAHGNKPDLVFTEAGLDLTVSSCTMGIFISDHKLVTTTLKIRKLKL